MNIGKNIKEVRKGKGLTQKELGKILDVSQATIAQFESDKSTLKLDTIEKIADALDVPLSAFVRDMKSPTWEKSEHAIRQDAIIDILNTHNYKIKKDNLYYIITSPQENSYIVSFSKFDDMIARSDKDIIYNIDKILSESKRTDEKE